MQSHCQSEFSRNYDVSQIRPRLGGLPHLSCNFSIRLEHPNSRLLRNLGDLLRGRRDFGWKTLKRLSKRNWKAQKGVACEYSCFYLLLAARDVVKGPWRWGARRNGCIRRLRKDACTRESDRNMTFVVRRHQMWCVMSDLDLGEELAVWGDVVAKKVIQKKGTFSSKGSNWVHSLDGLDKLMGHQNSTFRVPFPFN